MRSMLVFINGGTTCLYWAQYVHGFAQQSIMFPSQTMPPQEHLQWHILFRKMMLKEFLAWPLLIFNSSVLRASLIKVNVLRSTAVKFCELKHQQLWGALMVNFAVHAFMTKASFGDPLPKTMRQLHSTCKPLRCIARAGTSLKQHVLMAFVAAIL